MPEGILAATKLPPGRRLAGGTMLIFFGNAAMSALQQRIICGFPVAIEEVTHGRKTTRYESGRAITPTGAKRDWQIFLRVKVNRLFEPRHRRSFILSLVITQNTTFIALARSFMKAHT